MGKRIRKELNCRISDKYILSIKTALKEIDKYKPNIIINCIGHIGKNNVDDCEKMLDKTLSSNTFAAIILAEVAIRRNIKLIHISSGCIFHYDYKKNRPLSEKNIGNYYNLYYSRTKIYSENVLIHIPKSHNILNLRIRVPLDNRPYPKNILTKLIEYKKIIDIPNSITYIPDFITALKHLIAKDAKGTFNIVCKNPLRYKDLLNVYQKYNPKFKYKLIPLKKLNLVRTNLVLSTRALEKTGYKVRSIKEICDECVKNYVKFS